MWQEIGRTCGTRTTDFLPRRIAIVTRTGRGIEQTFSEEDLVETEMLKVKMFRCDLINPSVW